ncbi:hypothetical protein [Niabella beijingensis]|uniref:hypothetical protein n=1 Tax=Niabella beijingensis TaxID=2872700 RepID=UPI001CBD053D|nr:hypothetical protein [Niabella beijingensis]MBZ4191924.1 hypothetical protein [Niabella beijingensis]
MQFLLLTIFFWGNIPHTQAQTISRENSGERRLPHAVINQSVLKEFFQAEGDVGTIETTIFEFSANFPEEPTTVYKVQATVDKATRSIEEVSDKVGLNGTKLKVVYSYFENNNWLESKEIFKLLPDKRWTLNRKSFYHYVPMSESDGATMKRLEKAIWPGSKDTAFVEEVVNDEFVYIKDKLVRKKSAGWINTYSYDSNGSVISEKEYREGNEAQWTLHDYSYEYDSNGSWIRKIEYVSSPGQERYKKQSWVRRISYQ